MKREWTEYLESIGFGELFLKRADVVLGFYQNVFPDQIVGIFISEYVDAEGNRQYENLWLFSPTLIMEAKKFLTEDNFDSTPLRNEIGYWCIKKTDYDFREASSKSRMALSIIFRSSIRGEFKASGTNCDHLKSLFSKYIIPNQAMCSAFGEQNATLEDQ